MRITSWTWSSLILARSFVTNNHSHYSLSHHNHFLNRSFVSSIESMSSSMASSAQGNEPYYCTPIQIGLTGSIGMGKSTVAQQFKRLGCLVFDADACVHQLYQKHGQGVDKIRQAFPFAVIDDKVHRDILSQHIMKNPSALKELEDIVHPLVAEERQSFLVNASRRGCLAVIYDIPLLFENQDKYSFIDEIIVVTANPDIQRTRVLSRPGMTESKFQLILQRQVPDARKRELAHHVVCTDAVSYAPAKAQVARIFERIVKKYPRQWSWFQSRRGVEGTEPIGDCVEYNGVSFCGGGTAGGKQAVKIQSSQSFEWANHLDMILFDLDDTLIRTSPLIQSATMAMVTTLHRLGFPLTADAVARGKASVIGSRLAVAEPDISHDYTELRRRSLLELIHFHNETSEDKDIVACIENAIEEFLVERSKANEHLFADVLPCLRYLRSKGIRTGIISNGNAIISPTTGTNDSTLESLISVYLRAADIGAMKPSIVPFLAAAQICDVPVTRTLYIGDSFDHDVIGARQAGLHACWLRRPARSPPGAVKHESIMSDTEFITVTSLDPEHLVEQVSSYFNRPKSCEQI